VRVQNNDNVESAPRSANDWALLVDVIAKHSDANAFKSLFNHFAPRVKSFMLRSGLSEGAAEEIAQETLMTVWRKAEQYNREKAAVSTWVFTIARNKKIDKFRKDSRPLPDVNDPSFSMQDEVCPEDATDQSLNADKLYEALEALPEDQKQVLVMSFIKDNPHREIAEALDIPLGTVKSRIRLGLTRLRAVIGEHNNLFIGDVK
jgi:RNA polymerase sigma-70 factor (ECF subfamily)